MNKRIFIAIPIWSMLAIFNIQAAQMQPNPSHTIKQQVLTKQHQIENWHLRRLYGIRLQAEEEALRLKKSDKVLWTEFFAAKFNLSFSRQYLGCRGPIFLRGKKRTALRKAMIESYFLETTADFLMDSRALELLDTIVYNNNESPKIRREARKLLDIMEVFNQKITGLYSQKETLLGKLKQWEKEQLAIEKIPEAEEAYLGVVSAINYEPNNSFIMVNREILRQGSFINNVKVLSIQKYKIQFEKNGKKWTQLLGGPPNKAWTRTL